MSDSLDVTAPGRAPLLWRYYVLSSLGLLLNLAGALPLVPWGGVLVAAFVFVALLTGTLIFGFPVQLLALLLNRGVEGKKTGALFRRFPRIAAGLVYGAAVAGYAAVHLFLYFDRFIFRMYGFHFNGFVWNLLTTRGGIESMGAGGGTQVTFALIVALFIGLQAGLLAVLLKVPRARSIAAPLFTRKAFVAGLLLFAAGVTADKITYGLCRFKLHAPVLQAAEAFPLYIPCGLSSIAKRLGLEEGKAGPRFRLDSSARDLNYPLAPIRRDPGRPLLNVVWLVAESWRWDMLDPEIMPATWAFARRGARFTNHYSGGNGTRMGMFSMFYGLPGSYWLPFLTLTRGPVLVDLMVDENYEMELYTSALFTYPEFDRTNFARVPRERLHEAGAGLGWVLDRENVGRLLGFIGGRDPSRPFFAFMFFESPHAPYHFPEECAIRKPYPPEMNYLTLDMKKEAPLIRNRYVNACRHLDTQFERVLKSLEERGLLESTIVVLTGDHGEELMEKGRWGHGSAFTEEQVRVPLVLFAPGRTPEVSDRLSSHLDLPATVMTLLGAANPPSEYSTGFDLFGAAPRPYAILSDWDHIAYADLRYKAELPLKTFDLVSRGVTTRDDVPVADRAAFYEGHQAELMQVLKDLGRFLR